jgi:hypothetical protein
MAVVKANYVKRGKGDRGRAKATIRYITHRRDKDGHTVTRTLFSYDGALTKQQAYRMIDEAPQKGTIFYRIVLSPAPAREDRYKDLDLTDITLHTMLALEERLGKQIQFVAAMHDDHVPHRHVHTLVLVQGKLTREDFQTLREGATQRALFQRRQRDLIRDRHHMRLKRVPNASLKRSAYRSSKPYQSYTCSLCQYHQALPATAGGYRCPSCGIHLRRDRSYGFGREQSRQRGFGLELTLSP